MITKADEGPDTAAKDFLLEEYRSFADSFWKHEQSGETRFNFFLALITAVLAGLVAMGADGGVSGGILRVIVAAALLGLVAVGVVTFTRILKRNESTEGINGIPNGSGRLSGITSIRTTSCSTIIPSPDRTAS